MCIFRRGSNYRQARINTSNHWCVGGRGRSLSQDHIVDVFNATHSDAVFPGGVGNTLPIHRKMASMGHHFGGNRSWGEISPTGSVGG